jgi:hypothetical protein
MKDMKTSNNWHELIDKWNDNPAEMINSILFIIGCVAFTWVSFYIANKLGLQ